MTLFTDLRAATPPRPISWTHDTRKTGINLVSLSSGELKLKINKKIVSAQFSVTRNKVSRIFYGTFFVSLTSSADLFVQVLILSKA